MGMFDTYVPASECTCPVCGDALLEWQGKDGPCNLYTWHQGAERPDEPLQLPEIETGDLLPERFSIYSNDCDCPYFVHADCESTDGVWTRMEIVTGSNAKKWYGETKVAFERRLKWLRGEL